MRVALLLCFLVYSAYCRGPIEDQAQEDDDRIGDVTRSELQHRRFRRSLPKVDDGDNLPDARTKKIPANIVAKEDLKSGEKEGGLWSKVKAHVVGLYEGVKESMGKVVDGISTLWKDNSTPEQKVDLTPKHVRREKSINNNEYKQPEGVTPAWSAQGQPLEAPLYQQADAQWKLRTESSESEETTLEEASMEKFAPEGARSKSESSEHVTSESEMAEASLDVIKKASWNHQKTETQNSAQSENHAQDTKSLSNSLKSQGPLRKQSMTTETPSKPGPSRQNIYTRRPWNHHQFKVLKAKTKGTTELTRDEHEIAPWAEEYQPYLNRYFKMKNKAEKSGKENETKTGENESTTKKDEENRK